jgi:hypothetical protein
MPEILLPIWCFAPLNLGSVSIASVRAMRAPTASASRCYSSENFYMSMRGAKAPKAGALARLLRFYGMILSLSRNALWPWSGTRTHAVNVFVRQISVNLCGWHCLACATVQSYHGMRQRVSTSLKDGVIIVAAVSVLGAEMHLVYVRFEASRLGHLPPDNQTTNCT